MRPVVHFLPCPGDISWEAVDHTCTPPRFVGRFLRAQRGLGAEEEVKEGDGGVEVEALAKESLNYKTTDVDERPKNPGGRGGLSRFASLRARNCCLVFPNLKCPSWRTMKGQRGRSIGVNET